MKMNNNDQIPRSDSIFAALVLIKLAYKEGLIERSTYLNIMKKYGGKYGWKNGNGQKQTYIRYDRCTVAQAAINNK